MAETNTTPSNGQPITAGISDRGADGDDPFFISSKAFEDQFDESILQALDVTRWRLGNDLDKEYQRIEREVREAEQIETERETEIREKLLPELASFAKTTVEDISAVHRGLLFNGGVEACDGAIQIHETLPLTIYQIGVSLVSYRGDQGTWGQRLFRRDLRQKGLEVEDILDFLARRDKRDSSARIVDQDNLGELIQKTMLQYAERAILLRRSEAVWRLGHGNPITYELLTGGGNLDLMVAATSVLRELVEVYRKFVFLAGEPREALFRTIGQALHPMEYAIIGTLDERLESWLRQQRFKVGVSRRLMWNEESITPAEWVQRVIHQVAPKIVIGLFRPTLLAPAQTFYAHIDHSDVAAHIALADSVLKEQGTSMLLEMAHRVCTSVFGDSLEALAEAAYVAAGAHNRFLRGRLKRVQ